LTNRARSRGPVLAERPTTAGACCVDGAAGAIVRARRLTLLRLDCNLGHDPQIFGFHRAIWTNCSLLVDKVVLGWTQALVELVVLVIFTLMDGPELAEAARVGGNLQLVTMFTSHSVQGEDSWSTAGEMAESVGFAVSSYTLGGCAVRCSP